MKRLIRETEKTSFPAQCRVLAEAAVLWALLAAGAQLLLPAEKTALPEGAALAWAALLQPCDSSGALYVTPHSSEAVEVFDPGPSFPGEPPEPPPAPETVTLESVGITSEMISQIDFPEHQDPVPFSV